MYYLIGYLFMFIATFVFVYLCATILHWCKPKEYPQPTYTELLSLDRNEWGAIAMLSLSGFVAFFVASFFASCLFGSFGHSLVNAFKLTIISMDGYWALGLFFFLTTNRYVNV
jgi:hypothetical protein